MDEFLKKCFTYCAIFPKGSKIVKCDLIYQWISLGFIKPSKMFSILQLCENYIVRLQGLSFLQHYSVSPTPTTYGAYGEHDTFTMHDLVHDLAISLLGDQFLDQSKQYNNGGSSCCYALLTDCSKPLESWMSSPVRLSALHFLDCRWTELHGAAFEPAESLLVLDLSECSIQKLPDSIGRLKQLRYLKAPRIRNRMVPECITKLSNLVYLSLHGSCSILSLPKSIGEMEGLVHLDLSGCMAIKRLPKSFGALKSLEYMNFTNCKNITGVSKCLARLTKLQYLNLSNCTNIEDVPRALGSLTELQYLDLSNSAYLSGKKLAEAEFLRSLTKLKYLNLSSSNTKGCTIRLPEALAGLTKLKYLNLSHHLITGKYLASFGNLYNLVHLDLSCCSFDPIVAETLNGPIKCSDFDAMEGLQEILGNLRELGHLNLGNCISYSDPDKINSLLGRICTLANLEYLNLCQNENIYSIPETIGNLTKLHTLDLSYCIKLQRLPVIMSKIVSLKFLYTTGCLELDGSTLPQYKSTSKVPPHFVAHTGDGESISSYTFQLEYRNPALLKIRELENVKSVKEAQAIEVVKKTDIKVLALEWTRDAKRFVDDSEILKELLPPYSVSSFRLQGYDSVSFPAWVVDIGTYLPDLTRIEMSDLPRCNRLPPLGQLPNLKYLEIRRMDIIEEIGADLYVGTSAFPRLEHFVLDDMKCLEEWNTDYSGSPCLVSVEIRHCPRLRFYPGPPQIIDLRVHSSDKVMMSTGGKTGYVGNSSATRLRVECCGVPLYRWTLLHHLPYLERLWIIKCRGLIASTLDFLRGLTSLQTLTVRDCESIVSLPEWLADFTSLTELNILNCSCKGIETQPDTIEKLTRLQRLKILGCPELVRWCESEENKMKLVHIKNRRISLELTNDDEESETYEESESEDLENGPEGT